MKKIFLLTTLMIGLLYPQSIPPMTPNFKLIIIPKGYTGDWAGSITDTTANRGLNANALKLEMYLGKIFTSTFRIQQTFMDSLAALGGVASSGNPDSLNGHPGSWYAPLASPTFTGTPKILTDTLATKAYARSVGGIGADSNRVVFNDKLNSIIKTTGLNLRDSARIAYVDSTLWITANAYYDGANWQRMNITKPAYGLSFFVGRNFPNEAEGGVALWVASAGANPISPTFGSVGGWELGWDVTAFRDMVVGGYGIEVDGHGTLPYGRIINTFWNGSKYKGLLSNLFVDFSARDDNAEASWFIGQKGDSVVIGRLGRNASIVPSNVVYPFIMDSLSNIRLSSIPFISTTDTLATKAYARSLATSGLIDSTLMESVYHSAITYKAKNDTTGNFGFTPLWQLGRYPLTSSLKQGAYLSDTTKYPITIDTPTNGQIARFGSSTTIKGMDIGYGLDTSGSSIKIDTSLITKKTNILETTLSNGYAAYRANDTIRGRYETIDFQIDSTLQNIYYKVEFSLFPASRVFLIDSVAFKGVTPYGNAVSITPRIYYNDSSLVSSGTSIQAFSACTSTALFVSQAVSTNPTVPAGNYLIYQANAVTTACQSFRVRVYGRWQ